MSWQIGSMQMTVKWLSRIALPLIGSLPLCNLLESSDLKATKELIIDDLNCVITPLQRLMLKEHLAQLDKRNIHIKNLDNEIDNFMKLERKSPFMNHIDYLYTCLKLNLRLRKSNGNMSLSVPMK